MAGFSWLDFFIVIFYLVGVAIAGLYLAGKQKSSDDYFLGAHHVPWIAVLFSIVATETSALTIISAPAIAYSGNLTFLQITFGYFIGRVFVAFFFLPRYFQHNLETAYAFIGRKFGPKLRQISSLVFMITRLLADGVRVFACAIPIAMILSFLGLKASPLMIYTLSIAVVSLVTLIYTYLGGIRAVIWTDTLQLGLYLSGAIFALILILAHLPQNISGALAFLKEKGKFHFFASGFSLPLRQFLAEPYTFFVALIGGAFFSLASHGTDQLIVQRLLATKKLVSSQKALIGSGLFIIFQFALFLFVGLFLFAFYQGQKPAELGLATSDEIFIKFIVEEMPRGASGLLIASILAAAMSTLASAINSLASSTFFDLKLFRPKNLPPNEVSSLRLSRLFSLFWGIFIFLAALFFAQLQLKSPNQRPAVIELGLGIASYTYGGLLGLFFLGLLFPQAGQNEALMGFSISLIALLFLVKGPIQTLLPGEGLALAWPLYVVVGSAIVVVVGGLGVFFRKLIKPLSNRLYKKFQII